MTDTPRASKRGSNMVSTGVQEEASDEDFNTPGGKSRQVRIHDF